MSAAVDDDFAITVAAAQVFVVNGFDSVLANDIARLVMLLFVARLIELVQANLLHITEHVGQQAISRVASLRRLLDAQRRKFQLMGVNPGDINRRSVFLNENRFKRWLRL